MNYGVFLMAHKLWVFLGLPYGQLQGQEEKPITSNDNVPSNNNIEKKINAASNLFYRIRIRYVNAKNKNSLFSVCKLNLPC